jgi:hypothetical protein
MSGSIISSSTSTTSIPEMVEVKVAAVEEKMKNEQVERGRAGNHTSRKYMSKPCEQHSCQPHLIH